ncbi:Low-affinity phosphate transporter PHO91, partial [Wickerhamiella sorbophila]
AAMKFSSALQFNAVPEWRDNYVDYGALKKLLYALEKESLRPPNGQESAALMARDPEPAFTQALNQQLKKVDSFYQTEEVKTYEKEDALCEEVSAFDFPGSPVLEPGTSTNPGIRSEASDSSENEMNTSTLGAAHRRKRKNSTARKMDHHDEFSYRRISLKRELISMYVSLNELSTFVDINKTGFRKILKKFDKTLGLSLLPIYTEEVIKQTHIFKSSTQDELARRIDRVVREYADLVLNGDEVLAAETLKGYLREHVVYERNTVWRDMIGMERHTQAVGTDKEQMPHSRIRVCGIALPDSFSNPAIYKLTLISTIFLLLLAFPVLQSRPQSNCFAIVIAASLLWATEAIPLFVTSLLVPLLVVVLRVPVDNHGHALTAKQASDFVFSKMWSPVITVLLGGFTLAAALSKYNIAKAMAVMILSRSGTNPRVIVLVLMFVAAFLCMWISNVAAPVLLYSVAQPLLRTLPTGDGFAKAIILGIALASNVGGMASPIASPQNIIALQNMTPELSWTEWFSISLPVCILSITLVWLLLVLTFPPSSDASAMGHIRDHADKFSFVHYYILGVTVLTIALWCLEHQAEFIVGDMGILGFVPIILLFGPGILSAADFNNFLWTIIALAMGGVTMGKAVESCGLLATVATAIEAQVRGLSLFSVVLVFGFMILVIASFISHTVAALIVLPLVKSIGEEMTDPHPRVLVMISAFLCSAAMALPTSGFPNVTAICMTDEFGVPYLTVMDFITRGIPASVLVYIVVVLVGYAISRWIGL